MNGKYEIGRYHRLIEKAEIFDELVGDYKGEEGELICKAYHFACEAHKTQKRKATSDPYVIHCIDVANILMKCRQPAYLVAAGLLHDTVEDHNFTGVTEEIMKSTFGSRITELVMDVTEKDKSKPWQTRKDEAIEHVKNSGRDAKILKCADKLSNMTDMKETFERLGDAMWGMGFKGSKDGHKRNFQKLASAISDISGTEIYGRYIKELKKFSRI